MMEGDRSLTEPECERADAGAEERRFSISLARDNRRDGLREEPIGSTFSSPLSLLLYDEGKQFTTTHGEITGDIWGKMRERERERGEIGAYWYTTPSRSMERTGAGSGWWFLARRVLSDPCGMVSHSRAITKICGGGENSF
jgi:hypothetical protein